MINDFIQYLQYEKNYSSHTVLSYHTDLIQFCDFLQIAPDDFNPKEIQADIIRQWVLKLLDGKNTARSISRKISTLKSFWKFLQLHGLAEQNPTLKIVLPKTKKTLPAFYKQNEMEQVMAETKVLHSYEQVRDHLIIRLLYECGLRVSELVSLVDQDFEVESKQLKVLGKRNKQRIVPMSNELSEKISEYKVLRNKELKRFDNSLFVLISGKSMYTKAVYNIVHREMSKVSTLHKQSPHVLRHTFATSLLNNGADINAVKDLLGHSSLAATQVYTHVTFSELNKIYKQAHPRANKKGGNL
ncbi:MAG TPA: tyrosine-type recombinase/integrase [Paludibacteraceae bacterium]|nr:tyrosine-type recombinase/integrase [Paludibacteraceae bacterium]